MPLSVFGPCECLSRDAAADLRSFTPYRVAIESIAAKRPGKCQAACCRNAVSRILLLSFPHACQPCCSDRQPESRCLSPYKRLYCAVQSSVHVLTTPSMSQAEPWWLFVRGVSAVTCQAACLRGGPRVPVFGSVSSGLRVGRPPATCSS